MRTFKGIIMSEYTSKLRILRQMYHMCHVSLSCIMYHVSCIKIQDSRFKKRLFVIKAYHIVYKL